MYSINDNIPEKDFLILQFATKYVTKSPGNRLAVCGSVPELGEWNLQFAALADERPANSGKWLTTIQIPPEIDMEWKWVEVKQKLLDISAVCWEDGPKRRYNTGFEGGRLDTEWNKKCDFHHVPTENEGVEWDIKDQKQIDNLLGLLEQKATEQMDVTNSMDKPKEGVFKSVITWLSERCSLWWHFLRNSFRFCVNKFFNTEESDELD